jgi:hypothetical protein
MGVKKVQYSFTGGEVSPSMFGRADDQGYQRGLAKCKNFIALPQGPVTLRPGTEYVNQVKGAAGQVRIIPFVYSLGEAIVLELGHHYIRFHYQGKTLLKGDGQPYEIETPYDQKDLFDIRFVQSMDVMTLVHSAYPPKELRRYSMLDWRLVDINFSAPLPPPQGVGVTYSVPGKVGGVDVTGEERTRYTLKYKVTAVKEDGSGNKLEGSASTAVSTAGNLYLSSAKATITWQSVAGATRYRVYRSYKGVYSFIGETENLSFDDENFDADSGITPPIYEEPFTVVDGITSVNVETQGSGYTDNSVMDVQIPDYVRRLGTQDSRYRPAPYTFYGWDSDQFIYNPPVAVSAHIGSGRFSVTVEDDVGSGAVLEPVFSAGNQIRDKISSGGKPIDRTYYYSTSPIAHLTGFKVIRKGSGYTSKARLKFDFDGVVTVVRSYQGSNFSTGVAVKYNGYGEYTTYDGVHRTPKITLGGKTTIDISDSTGYGAKAEPVIVDGQIVAVRMLASGTKYTAPQVRAVNDAGHGATFSVPRPAKTGGYPASVCYYEQRRCFGGTPLRPQSVWMTKTFTESDMSYTIPTQDDNRVQFNLAAQEASQIMHMTALNTLLVLTSSTEYRVTSGGSQAIAPDAIDAKAQSQIGSSRVAPIVFGTSLVFAAARGGHLMELGYNQQVASYITGDLSVRATHLFENAEIKDMALQRSPDSIIWCAMSDGRLLGFTYMPNQNVGAWHQHEFVNGTVESVCVVPEGQEDSIYVVVRRMISDSPVKYIERMRPRMFTTLDNAWYVDCGGEYRGEATDTVTGLTWLEGQTVSILADGCVHPQQTVTDGAIKLQHEARHVIIGLPITGEVATLPATIPINDGSMGNGHMKNINKAWLRVYQSSGVFVGSDPEKLYEVKQRTNEPYGEPPAMITKAIEIVPSGVWTDAGQLYIKQADPLPLTLVSATWEFAT